MPEHNNLIVFQPDPCPQPIDIVAQACQDTIHVRTPDTVLSGLGRIVQMDVLLKNICPGKQVAAAVILYEPDEQGVEHPRGTKTILVPAQTGTECRDILLQCVTFVVPEALVRTGDPASICAPRTFQARVIANYVDTDFACCDPQVVTI